MACTQLQRQHNMESGIEEHDMPRRGRGGGGLAGMDWVLPTCLNVLSERAANNGLMWGTSNRILYFFTPLTVEALAAYTQHVRADGYLPHKCIALVLEHAYLLYCAIGREGLLQDVLIEEAR